MREVKGKLEINEQHVKDAEELLAKYRSFVVSQSARAEFLEEQLRQLASAEALSASRHAHMDGNEQQLLAQLEALQQQLTAYRCSKSRTDDGPAPVHTCEDARANGYSQKFTSVPATPRFQGTCLAQLRRLSLLSTSLPMLARLQADWHSSQGKVRTGVGSAASARTRRVAHGTAQGLPILLMVLVLCCHISSAEASMTE